MKRSTSVARAPGVSVCGMINSLSVATVSQLVTAEGLRRPPGSRLRSGGNRRVRVDGLFPCEGTELVDPESGSRGAKTPRRQLSQRGSSSDAIHQRSPRLICSAR